MTRKCRICKAVYVPTRPMQAVCGNIQCAIEQGNKLRLKKAAVAKSIESKRDAVRKEALRPRKWWIAKTKTAMHAFVRARDEGKKCISCETILLKLGRLGGDYDAGHFRSVGSAKHLQFEIKNIHGQCKHCNDALTGNPIGYERGLIERYGVEYVESLKNDNEPRKLTIADFQALEAEYKLKLKNLKAGE